MCGIAGIVGVFDREFAVNAARQMSETLARRGTDSEGIEVWDQAVLAHRRLSIFDLSDAGRQPMVSKDRSIGVVFNGAIYNFRDLRKELEGKGYAFKSNADTEVLIHGYAEWGIDKLVASLRGMFAFAIWDDRLKKLFLVRDRMGVKPLAYVMNSSSIAFASNVRALRSAGFVSELDDGAVAQYLRYGFVPDQYSIYRGAVKVQAATIVEWHDSKLKTWRYWTLPAPAASSSISFSESVEQAEHLLLNAVEMRLQADVPVGLLLSGGIDSALVCWAVAKLGRKVTAYTIGTPGDVWDETANAQATAKQLGLDHHVLEMRAEYEPSLEELTLAYAEPFACASALGMLRVSRCVASSAKVLLTGDGGDDVFLGYPRHLHVWIADKVSRIAPGGIKEWWRANGSKLPKVSPLNRMATLFDYVVASPDIFGCIGFGPDKFHLLGQRLLANNTDPSNIHTTDGPLVANFLAYEYRNRFVGEYMTKVDGATMHYGLEARSPFLDQGLWEFASSLPFHLRLHHGHLKAILREIAHKRISKDLAKGRKRGFGIPVHRWMTGTWLPIVSECLRESVLSKEGWVRQDSMLALLDLALAKGEAPLELWYLFVLELWIRREQSLRCKDFDPPLHCSTKRAG